MHKIWQESLKGATKMKILLCSLLMATNLAMFLPTAGFPATAANLQAAAKTPDPTHKLEYVPASDGSKGALDFKITYSDGTAAIYDGLHKPVIVNGGLVKTATYVLDGRTYVPIRPVGESLGLSVEWDGSSRTAVIQGEKTVELSIGSAEAKADGEAKAMDAPVAIVEGLTCVPLAFVSEAFGVAVWYAAAQEESIVSGVNGNILISEGEREAAISQEEAVTRAKAEIGALFESFKSSRSDPKGSESRKEANQRLYTRMSGMIDSISARGEVAGYYILSGPKEILFDKSSGVMYFKGKSENGSFVSSLASDYGRFDIFEDYFAS
jgi:hypothetical protein